MVQDAIKVSSNGIALNSLNWDPDPSVSVSLHISSNVHDHQIYITRNKIKYCNNSDLFLKP